MNKKNKTDWSDIPETKKVFDKMAQVVGFDSIDEIDTSEDGWFMKHKWTAEQEKEFADWLTDYLYKNKKAQREILVRTTRSKKILKDAVNDFVFMYGWKYKAKEEK